MARTATKPAGAPAATTPTESTALAKVDSANGTLITVGEAPPSLALARQGAELDEIAAAFAEELGESERMNDAKLPLILINHKKERFLHNTEEFDEIQGYIVHIFQSRAYWSKPYSAANPTPPDCVSPDTISPSTAVPVSPSCIGCPMAEFGSANDKKGQACKTITTVVLVNPTWPGIPVACLQLPPSSIKRLLGNSRSPGYWQNAKFFRRPDGKQVKFPELVWTSFKLGAGGDDGNFAVIVPEAISACMHKEEATILANIRKSYEEAIQSMRGYIPQPDQI